MIPSPDFELSDGELIGLFILWCFCICYLWASYNASNN